MSDENIKPEEPTESHFCTAESTDTIPQNILRMWCQKFENQQLEIHYKMKEASERKCASSSTHVPCGEVEKFCGFSVCPLPHSLGLLSSSNAQDNSETGKQGSKSTATVPRSKRPNVKCGSKESFNFRHNMSADQLLQEYREKFIYTRSRLAKVDRQALQSAATSRPELSSRHNSDRQQKSAPPLDQQSKNSVEEAEVKNRRHSSRQGKWKKHFSNKAKPDHISGASEGNNRFRQRPSSTRGKLHRSYKKRHFISRRPLTINVVHLESADFDVASTCHIRKQSLKLQTNSIPNLEDVCKCNLLIFDNEAGDAQSQTDISRTTKDQQGDQATRNTLPSVLSNHTSGCSRNKFERPVHSDQCKELLSSLTLSNYLQSFGCRVAENNEKDTADVISDENLHLITDNELQQLQTNKYFKTDESDILKIPEDIEYVQLSGTSGNNLKPYARQNTPINKDKTVTLRNHVIPVRSEKIHQPLINYSKTTKRLSKGFPCKHSADINSSNCGMHSLQLSLNSCDKDEASSKQTKKHLVPIMILKTETVKRTIYPLSSCSLPSLAEKFQALHQSSKQSLNKNKSTLTSLKNKRNTIQAPMKNSKSQLMPDDFELVMKNYRNGITSEISRLEQEMKLRKENSSYMIRREEVCIQNDDPQTTTNITLTLSPKATTGLRNTRHRRESKQFFTRSPNKLSVKSTQPNISKVLDVYPSSEEVHAATDMGFSLPDDNRIEEIGCQAQSEEIVTQTNSDVKEAEILETYRNGNVTKTQETKIKYRGSKSIGTTFIVKSDYLKHYGGKKTECNKSPDVNVYSQDEGSPSLRISKCGISEETALNLPSLLNEEYPEAAKIIHEERRNNVLKLPCIKLGDIRKLT